jgi:hypothetical protein
MKPREVFENLKGKFDVTADYSRSALVGRRRWLLRIFEMGSGGIGIVGLVLIVVVLFYALGGVSVTR